jgi:hypothetical protein
MEETFKKEDALKEEIAWLEEENKKLLLQLRWLPIHRFAI